jgi:hypothetical protein
MAWKSRPDTSGGEKVRFRTVQLNDTEWTALRVSMDCNCFVVRNLPSSWWDLFTWLATSVRLRTEVDNEASEIELPVNAQEGVTVPSSSGLRFAEGEVVFYARSGSGSTAVTLVSIL